MNLRHRLVWLIAAIVLFFGCQDSTKSDKPKVVRQKITADSPDEMKKQELASSTVTAGSAADLMSKEKGEPKSKSSSVDPATELLASKGATKIYRYKSILDPFVPLIKEEKDQSAPSPVPSDVSQKKKRTPQTPLEKIDLSQLTLTAVFRDNKSSMAMVEESTGKGYIVKGGTYIGLDGGKITKITKDRIFITEVSQDVMGKPVTIERELKLRQFSGE